MPFLLSALAAIAALIAVAAALRTARHVQRLARSLAREWGQRGAVGATPVEPEVRSAAPAREHEAWLRRSVEALEQRLREALERTAALERRSAPGAAPSADGPEGAVEGDPRERVLRHLAEQGFEEVALLGASALGRGQLFEARREGLPVKGRARVGDDGRVELTLAGVSRVFP